MTEPSKKVVTLSYGAFAAVLMATLLIGLISGAIFGRVVALLLTQRLLAPIAQASAPARSWLGITYIPLTPAVARSRNLSTTSGALVVFVTPSSPAAKAGLQEGDIITAIGQSKVDDTTSILDLIKGKKPGDRVEVTYLRSDSEQTTEVVLGRSPALPTAPSDRSPFDRLRRFITDVQGE